MHMRDGVFATNREDALTCMRCDTTSPPFASSNRWDGPGAFTKRPPRSVLVPVIREISPERASVVLCAWQPPRYAESAHRPLLAASDAQPCCLPQRHLPPWSTSVAVEPGSAVSKDEAVVVRLSLVVSPPR